MKTAVTPKRAILLAAWAISLILVASYGHSQTPATQPTVLSGNDVGFSLERVERVYASGRRGSVAIGSWVVKVDGRWIPVQSVESPSMKRIGE